jgi:hypothetical protein
MRIMKTIFAGTAGLAAIAAAAPAAAQYAPYNPYAQSYGYQQPYGYGQQYGYAQRGYAQPYGYQQSYGYGAYGGMNTNVAAQQCSAAVQNRLSNRAGIAGILGAALGVNTSGRVLSITQVAPRNNGTVRVRGLASSGRYASNGYGPYGVGAYGASGYGYASAADLSFRCDVDYRGYVRNVDINRR